MVLVFILLGIIILILTITLLILLSTFHLEIINLEATNIKEKASNNTGYAIILSLYLCNKFKWIWIHLNDEKLRKAYSKMQLEKIDFKKLEQDFKWEDLKIIKKIKPKVSYFNLNASLGTQSPVVTSFLVAILSSIISIFLPHVIIDFKNENYKYNIVPIYQNRNLYKINFNCIIQVKMVHIINVIFIFLKKGRSDFNERTTSNRRSYGYSYE